MSASREDQDREDQKAVQQKYEALLGVLKENSKGLSNVVHEIDLIIKELYEKNEKLQQLAIDHSLITGKQDETIQSYQSYIDKLTAIQSDLNQTNSEIFTVAKTISLLSGKTHDLRNNDTKEFINANLDELNALNERYGKQLQELHTKGIAPMLTLLNQANLADPAQTKKLDDELTKLHEQVKVLKDQVKTKVEQKQKPLENINQVITSSRPGSKP